MAAGKGFSIGSVILSYFLVAGGIGLAFWGFAMAKILTSEAMVYTVFGVGGFVGGLFAGKASRGHTVTEAAIGGVLVIATMLGVFMATPIGKLVWHLDSSSVGTTAIMLAACAAIGSVGGAILGEKWGDSTSGLAWILFLAVATIGSVIVSALVLVGIAAQGGAQTLDGTSIFLGGIAAGCFLSGMAGGAQAPRRAYLGSLLGGFAGGMLFFLLAVAAASRSESVKGEAYAGMAILAGAGGIITMLGFMAGWGIFGKKKAVATA